MHRPPAIALTCARVTKVEARTSCDTCTTGMHTNAMHEAHTIQPWLGCGPAELPTYYLPLYRMRELRHTSTGSYTGGYATTWHAILAERPPRRSARRTRASTTW